jgi:hypothetical protein
VLCRWSAGILVLSAAGKNQITLERNRMKARTRVFSLLGLFLVLMAVLLPVGRAMAQSSDDNRAAALLGGGVAIVFLIVGLAVYVYFSLAFQTIANKTNTPNAWVSWIPILHLILMPVLISKKPIWWILLCLIPLVNIVILIILWMAVAEARGKPSWWGILMIVPLVSLIVPGYLAWAD